MAVFSAAMDTLIATLNDKEIQQLTEKLCGKPNSIHSPEEVREFASHSGSSVKNWAAVNAFLHRALAVDKRQELTMILSLLSMRPGAFVLTGKYQRFQDMSREEREEVLLKWKDSYIPQFRLLYKLFFSATCHPTYGTLESPLHKGMKYPGTCKLPHESPRPDRLPMLTVDDLSPGLKFDAIVVGSGAGGGKASQ